jgi:hypothetical protein
MDHSMELVTETVGGEAYAYYPLGEYIVRAPGVCGGRPTSNTRVLKLLVYWNS